MRHPVRLVPGDLLGQEISGPGGRDDLRQAPPNSRTNRAATPPRSRRRTRRRKNRFPGHELPGHRLAARHVGVRLDPHPADRNELSRSHFRPDPVEQLRMGLLDPGELLRRRAGEDEVVVLVHQVQHGGERAGAFADRLPDRPQPRGVDVRMPDGVQVMRAGVGGRGQHPGQFGPAGRRGAGDVARVHRVHHPFQRAQDQRPAGQVGRQLGHQAGQHLDVPEQFPHRDVEQRQLDRAQPVQRRRRRRSPGRRAGWASTAAPRRPRSSGLTPPRRTARPASPGPPGSRTAVFSGAMPLIVRPSGS